MLQRVGQSLNAGGVASFARLALRDRGLAIPHLEVAHLGLVDWSRLRDAGFRGAVFDKDNTLTAPYSLELAPRERAALDAARCAFGAEAVALFSNSAGLEQFDPEGKEAEALEAALGVRVLRHREKKPSGGCGDVERELGAEARRLVMVGDRYLTDVVFGNRHGMLTVRPTPLTSVGEPVAVRAARWIEQRCVDSWRRSGSLAPPHPLLTDPSTALVASSSQGGVQ